MVESTDKLEHVTVLVKCHVNGGLWDLNTGSDSVQFAFDADYDFMTSELFRHLWRLLTSPDCLTFTLSAPSVTA